VRREHVRNQREGSTSIEQLTPGVFASRASAVSSGTSHMITYAISRELLQRVLDASPDVAAAMQAEVRRRYS
jgi:hypothetical protein